MYFSVCVCVIQLFPDPFIQSLLTSDLDSSNGCPPGYQPLQSPISSPRSRLPSTMNTFTELFPQSTVGPLPTRIEVSSTHMDHPPPSQIIHALPPGSSWLPTCTFLPLLLGPASSSCFPLLIHLS